MSIRLDVGSGDATIESRMEYIMPLSAPAHELAREVLPFADI